MRPPENSILLHRGVSSIGCLYRLLVYRELILLAATAFAVPGLMLFKTCNDHFGCPEVTRFDSAEGHLSMFGNRAEEILTTLTS